ncbi:hypothetical protein EDD86DRAFT_197169 [Gorgonomyces haynaldii]|nr:hypothetical protein EDD86DRAFT_197169 [Gorgonomyces haynaldii]
MIISLLVQQTLGLLSVTLETLPEWQDIPLALEITEAFGRYAQLRQLKNFNAFDKSTTSQQLFDRVFGEMYPEQVSVKKTQVLNRAFAPVIQAYYQMYQPLSSCETYIDFGGKIHCSIDDLDLNRKFTFTPLSIDKIYSSGDYNRSVAVLYGDPYAPTFFPLYFRLLDLANAGKLNLVWRYKPGHHLNRPLVVSGYGVELAVKNTEYKVADDRKIEAFSDLKITERVLFEDDKIVPLKEPKDLGLKAIQFVLEHKDPLETLNSLLQDFPKYAHHIDAIELNDTIRNDAQLLGHVQENALWINGKPLAVNQINVFSILNLIDEESRKMFRFNELGLDLDILTLNLENTNYPWGIGFDTRSELVNWFNDLEKDEVYHEFPKHVRVLGRPNFMQQLVYIRKNVFSCVFYLDTSSQQQLQYLLQVFYYLDQQIPMRFGLVPLSDDTPVGDLAAKMIYFVLSTKQQMDIRSLVNAILESGFTTSGLQKAYKRVFGHEFADDELDPLLLQKLGAEKRRLGEGLYCNGKHIELTNQWMQHMAQTYFSMIDFLTPLVQKELITDDTLFYDFFLELPNIFKSRNPAIFEPSPVRKVEDLEWISTGSGKEKVSLIVCADFEKTDLGWHALQLVDDSLRLSLVHNQQYVTGSLDQVSVAFEQSKPMDLTWKGTSFECGKEQVIINGRIVNAAGFEQADLQTLVQYESLTKLDALYEKLQDRDSLGDLMLQASIVLGEKKDEKRLSIQVIRSMFQSSLKIESECDKLVHFHAVLDPLSADGQKTVSILEKLKELACVNILFAPKQEKLDRFYRFVFPTEPVFGPDGELSPKTVYFTRLPEALLTLGMDVPEQWLVRPHKSTYDLDNIRVSSKEFVEASFVLSSILVQGHAFDEARQAPRGLQFVLGTKENPEKVDTITMANLGYVQLKAYPGVWDLQIRKGRSQKVYELVSVEQDQQQLGERVVLGSFEGVLVYINVKKRKGMEEEDVLQESTINSMFHGISKSLFGRKTINVFSVASGHLYERFLSIMMLSVKQQTKSHVKFWLIENFLSPSFLEFLPKLSKQFDFDYELVTYKWPYWLRQQTEKQRIIWAYKILFLDVLFPLKLDKVIFVDADQVVRTDLQELVDMDLKGAPYGYTPFCSDRTEMDGFRFWNQGYWKNHLQGRPYHISALYVVDLQRFRQLAAGDRLRAQYHRLSADPNSLANLDQDLPNNMIHEIPIFSLPQEWLWCETWCSDESLKTAKTIDLCNNPLTKEPKLDRAKRILSEWTDLDNQVQQLKQQRHDEL